MISIAEKSLNLLKFKQIVEAGAKIQPDAGVCKHVEENHVFLKSFAADKLIYGINTGFGPMAQYKVDDDQRLHLQYNLIRSHAAGSGQRLSDIEVRAMMLARLNSLLQARSGVHPDLIHLLTDLLNQGIYPVIPEHGGVGASGDLVQLAHLALGLIGEGEVSYQGELRKAGEVLSQLGLKPLTMHLREGLALLNGTSAMTGIGMLNLSKARTLLYNAILLSALTNEVVEAFDDHLSAELNNVKHHPGQQAIAGDIRGILADSKMMRKRPEHLYRSENLGKPVFEEKIQEYYSLRCISQVLGPVHDTIVHAEQILVDELNSVNDNPVIDHIAGNVFHGGNFHGDYVSLEMDKMRIVISKLCMLSERQLNYLLNDRINNKFPPFLNLGTPGFNFGIQGMQFAATSTVAENLTLSYPMYLHSIPSNNDNQDIVSMGCNAARLTGRVIENAFEILAVQAVALAQAVDYLQCSARLSSKTAAFYHAVRTIIPVFNDDQSRAAELALVKNYLKQNQNLS